jgi:hypothetical protein
MNRFVTYLIIACVVSLTGCAKKKTEAQEMRSVYESQGWEFVENVGGPVEDGIFMTSMTSGTGSITAFGVDGANRQSKEYASDSLVYRVASFQSPKTGASYSMVFRKKR